MFGRVVTKPVPRTTGGTTTKLRHEKVALLQVATRANHTRKLKNKTKKVKLSECKCVSVWLEPTQKEMANE